MEFEKKLITHYNNSDRYNKLEFDLIHLLYFREKFIESGWIGIQEKKDYENEYKSFLNKWSGFDNKEKHENLISEWGGSARCIASDGRNINMAEELNRLEKK